MSTAARKARKRAGETFVHPTKTPTPRAARREPPVSLSEVEMSRLFRAAALFKRWPGSGVWW